MTFLLKFRLNTCSICLICLDCKNVYGQNCICQAREVKWRKKKVERGKYLDISVERKHDARTSDRNNNQLSRVYFIFSICRQPGHPSTRQVLGKKFVVCPVHYEISCKKTYLNELITKTILRFEFKI